MAQKIQSYHVIANDKDGWSVRKTGSERAIRGFQKKADGIAFARSLAKRERSEVVVHRADGMIVTRDSYRPDPLPPVKTKTQTSKPKS